MNADVQADPTEPAASEAAADARRFRDIADTLQDALRPDRLPVVPGMDLAARYWASGRSITAGGDFYDVFSTGEGRWCCAVGDVCGSGPDAASLTALARHSIRMCAWHGDALDEILGWLNHAIEAESEPSTCTAAILDIRRIAGGHFELSCALGGHPRPLICHQDGSVTPFGKFGTLLGAVPDNRATVVTTTLTSGDAVVLYTDGITDVRPPEDLDEQRLCALIARCWTGSPGSVAFIGRIMDLIATHRHQDDPDDDVVLLVARVS